MVGVDNSCGLLIVINADRTVTVLGDPTVAPYDGALGSPGDDTLVGVQNNSSASVDALTVSGPRGSGIFGFDGDGVCHYVAIPCGSTGYEGPGTSFTFDPSTTDRGEVDFASGGLAAYAPAYFSLEGALTAASITARPGHLGQGCAASTPTNSGTPSFQVTVQGGNTSDTASGHSWAANEEVDIYLDTARGAHFVGQAFTDSNGAFGPIALAPLAQLFPSEPAELAASPNEAFPVVAMGNSCDAASVNYQVGSGPGLTNSAADGITVRSNSATIDGGCSRSGVPLVTFLSALPLPDTPLVTQGRWIVGKLGGQRVKLTSVNWYGAEEADFVPGGLQCQSISTIANEIARMGFNSVRLPWSNAMFEQNPSTCTAQSLALSQAAKEAPCIPPQVLAGNRDLIGLDAKGIYQHVVQALTSEHIMTILDNHSTDATFTPSPFDNIWWGGQYWDDAFGYDYNVAVRTQTWINDWVAMVNLFTGNSDVIGADLRNEPANTPYDCGHSFLIFGTHHCEATWGGGDPKQDWLQAAEDAGNAILRANSSLLIFVEGTNLSLDLTRVDHRPVVLQVADRVVYSPHSYPFSGFSDFVPYNHLATQLGDKWGYILTQNRPWTAPVWVGEFGATATDITGDVSQGNTCGDKSVSRDAAWFSCFTKYLANADIDWAYWALNGTQSDNGPLNPGVSVEANSGSRSFFVPETYGILDPSWSQNRSLGLVASLQTLQVKRQGP